MNLNTHLKTAIRNLTAAPLRSFLAMLGIMVGTASVVAMISGGTLATQQALQAIKNLGTDLMRLDFSASSFSIPPVDPNLILSMRNNIPAILQIAPIASYSTTGIYNKVIISNLNIIGTTENFANIVHIKMRSGRFIHHLDGGRNFCVLGSDIADQLNAFDPLGGYIRYDNGICTIIGIADSWPEQNIVNQNVNKSIIVPLQALQQNVSNSGLSVAMLQIKENEDIDTLKNDITDYFAKHIPDYKVNIQSAKEILNSVAKQQTIFTLLLGLIGGISLLVGGIGVMNIMLASVAERHSEIGLRMALGATPRDVQIMFLMEVAMLAILGGGLGVVMGVLSTLAIAYFANWNFIVLIWPPLIGFGVSLLISLFFGFYPAYIASKLNPIETLRS